MARKCMFTGKRTTSGRTICRKGMAKKKGGVGKKITGINKRKFKPNIQTVRVDTGGGVKRVKVCTKYLRSGKLAKPSLVKKQK